MRRFRVAAAAAGSLAIAGVVATPAVAASPASETGRTVSRVTVEGPAICVNAWLAQCTSVRLRTTGYDVTQTLPRPGTILPGYFFRFSNVPASPAATLTLASTAGSCQSSVSTRPIFRSLVIITLPPCGIHQAL
jgi:hypothetical protein